MAHDFGVSLNEFADEVIAMLARLPAAEIAASPADRCREACAAVWAAMVNSLDASSLTTTERAQLTPMLLEVLQPYWRKHCSADDDIPAMLRERAEIYLQRRNPDSQIKTAMHLVTHLLERLGVAEPRRVPLTTTFTAMFAHRMLGDIHRINDVRARFGIELPLVAALAALVQATMTCESVLRILRLV